jgi:uncharacterized glyoxalase superfamily protein PhnB
MSSEGRKRIAYTPDRRVCGEQTRYVKLHPMPFAKTNRSMPSSVVIPELAYPDVREAVEWLCRMFGFRERLRIADHRSQLSLGEGSVIVTGQRVDSAPSVASDHAVMVRVADVDDHYQRSERSGARIVSPPTDFPYGERQYTAVDLGGHRWTFSQTIADVDPGTWGGTLIE